MRHALAVAHLLQQRCSAAVAQVQHKCSELEREVEQLRRAAEAPPTQQPPQPPLLQLVAGEEAAPLAAGPPAGADPEALPRQLQSLAMWHQAAAALPPDVRPTLARAQRYLLMCELQRQAAAACGGGGLPAGAVLERTPMVAVLEMAADILHTHAAAAEQPPAGAAAHCQLSAAHGQLLSAACTCLVHLCEGPGQTALDSDYEALQRFYGMVLQLAAAPPPDPSPALAVDTPDQQQQATSATAAISQALAAGPEAQGEAAAAGLDLGQPTCQVAQHVLGVLRQSASAGTVLLSCTAPQTRDCMAALVAAITGEQLLMHCGPSGGGGGAASSAQQPDAPPDAAGPAEEARLLHAFTQLSQQLSAGLRLLPGWTRAMGLHNDAFMQARAGPAGRCAQRRPAALAHPGGEQLVGRSRGAAVASELSAATSPPTHPPFCRPLHRRTWLPPSCLPATPAS